MTLYRDLRDRKLEDRSFLTFNYPSDTTGKNLKVILPMYENMQIKESEKARLVTYSPLSRAGNLFAYTGADSRKFSVNFAVTLDHIINFGKTWDKHVFLTVKPGRTTTKEQFQLKDPLPQTILKGAVVRGEFYELLGLENVDQIQTDKKDNAISLVNYWVNIIRSSVLNNSINPILGPPIVRINHGILYRDVPCVCTDYSIDFDENAGYDLNTLLPKKIKVKLNLVETRTGNFAKYEPGAAQGETDRDTATGWESIIHHPYELDPNPTSFRVYSK